MPTRLFCKTGELAGTEHEIFESTTIGRDPDNQITVSLDSVAKKQARILFDPERNCYFLENLGVDPGTRLDGVVVKKTAKLDDLHVITLGGELDFIFVRAAKPSAESAPVAAKRHVGLGTVAAKPEAIAAPAFLRGSPGSPGRSEEGTSGTLFARIKKIALPSFVDSSKPPASKGREESAGLGTISAPREKLSLPSFLEGSAQTPPSEDPVPTEHKKLVLELELADEESPHTYALTDGKHTLGRSSDCEVRVEDSSVSRKHALLVVQSGVLTLKDLGSANNSYVNEDRVSSEVEVRSGSTVRFGRIKGRVVNEA